MEPIIRPSIPAGWEHTGRRVREAVGEVFQPLVAYVPPGWAATGDVLRVKGRVGFVAAAERVPDGMALEVRFPRWMAWTDDEARAIGPTV